MKVKKTNYQGIFQANFGKKRMLFTKSLDNNTFFNEKIIEGYREFNPKKSKLAAAIMKKISLIPIKKNSSILYLGASHGLTPSYISDMIGKNGSLFCVEFSSRVMYDLLEICQKRENMAPIFADANNPESYKNKITKVDIIYQDLAQKNQVEILFKNLKFLKPEGYVLLALKSRSIDVTKKPKIVFKEVLEKLKTKLKVIDFKELYP